MADITSERDRRIRELLSRNDAKTKNELGVVAQGQAEIQGLQGELASDMKMRQVQDRAQLQTTGVMAQAAGIAMEGQQQQAPIISQQVGRMNTSTQAIMQKYGVKPESSRKSTSTTSRINTGAGTTNVKNETITNNRTDIKITQPQIPVQPPQIRLASPQQSSGGGGALEKFKAWMSGMMAQQQNQAAIQAKEYRRKEWSIARSTTRIMKRIEEATKNMSNRLNPEVMTQSLGGQLKWLLLILGATLIGKVWKPIMKFLDNLETGFRSVFGLPIGSNLAKSGEKGVNIVDKIKEFIGIKDNDKDNTSLIKGIGTVFMQGIDKLLDKLKYWFEDRTRAIKEIEFPEIDTNFDIGGPLGSVLGPMMSGLSDTLKGIGQYIGDLLTVALGGSKGKVKAISNRIKRQSINTFTDTTNKETSLGDMALAKGGGRNYMRESDFGIGGMLKGNASSTQAMSRTLGSLFNDTSNVAHTAELASGVSQLFDVAKRNGEVIIDPELLSQLGLTQNDILQLKQGGGLIPKQFRLISVHPSSSEARDEYSSNWREIGGAVTGGILGAGAGLGAGMASGALAGTLFGGPMGTIVGGVVGLGGAILGGGAGTATGYGLGAGWHKNEMDKWRKKNLSAKLVPADSPEMSVDGSRGIPKTLFALTEQGANAVANKFMAGASNKDIDLANKEFYEKIRRIEERRKRSNGVTGALRQNLSTNELSTAQSQLEAYNRGYYEKFVSTDPNSWNMQHYGAYNTTMDNLGRIGDSIRGWAGEQLRAASTSLGGGGKGYASKEEVKKRVNFSMDYLMNHGLTKSQAAGIVGNLLSEGLTTKDLGREYPDGSGPSAGIAGFHSYYSGKKGELDHLKEFARKTGQDWTQLETQLAYLVNDDTGGSSSAVIQKIRRLTGDDNTVARESATIWGHDYERFAGYQNTENSNYANRRGRALTALKEFDATDIAYTKYESTSEAIIDLGGVDGTTTITEDTKFHIAWIGDIQTASGSGVLPKTVSAGIGKPIFYYGLDKATPAVYLGAEKNQKTPVTNITELQGKPAPIALSTIIERKPKYCIIALGHQGATGFGKLIGELRKADIKVVVIKMWPIMSKEGKRMTSAQMSSLYDGLSADNWVDLTSMNVPLVKDGVRATSGGYKIAAGEITKQLKTGTASRHSGDDAPSELANFLSAGLDFMADLIDPEGSAEANSSLKLSDPTEGMSDNQRKIFSKIMTQIDETEKSNTQSWLSLGAKTDEKGVYFQTAPDIKTYVRTDGLHNGMFGLREDDIDHVEAVGRKGGPGRELTEDEVKAFKTATKRQVDHMFSNYEEKTKSQGYDDYLKGKRGEMVFFDLGWFDDIQGFKKVAQEDFGGRIYIRISPTKDLTRYNVVGINGTIPCSMHFLLDYGNGPGKNGYKYGPLIYRKGAHWIKWGTLPEDKVYSDIQPICDFMRVRITPQAQAEAERCLNLLSETTNLEHTAKGWKKNDGSYLTKDEIETATRYGILKNVGGVFGSTVKSEKLDYAQRSKSKAEIDKKEYTSKSLLTKFGESKEERQKYYTRNKDQFEQVGNDLIEVTTGAKFASVGSDGNMNFLDTSNFTDGYSQTAAESNMERVNQKREDEYYGKLGMVSRDTMANYLSKSMSYAKDGKLKKGGKAKNVRMTTAIAVTVAGQRVPLNFKYDAYYFPSGDTKYSVTENQLAESISESDGERLGIKISKKNLKIEANSYEDFIQKVADYISRNSSGVSGSTRNLSGGNKIYNDIAKYAIQNGKRIVGLGKKQSPEVATIEFDDGSVKEFPIFLGKDKWRNKKTLTSLPVGWVKQVNDQVDFNQNQLLQQAQEESYVSSGMKQVYDDMVKRANSGELTNYRTLSNGYVVSSMGDVFGKMGKDGKITSINAGEAYKVAKDSINGDSNLRRLFYQGALGLSRTKEKDGSTHNYFSRKTKAGFNYRIDVNTNTDLNTFEKNGLSAFKKDTIKVMNANGQWVDANEEQKNEIFKDMSKSLEDLKKNGQLNNAFIKTFRDQNKAQLDEAAKERIKQRNIQISQAKEQRDQTTYLATIAKNAANGNEDLKRWMENNLKESEGLAQKQRQEARDIEYFLSSGKSTTGVVALANGRSTHFVRKSDLTHFNSHQDFLNAVGTDKNGDGVITNDEINKEKLFATVNRDYMDRNGSTVTAGNYIHFVEGDKIITYNAKYGHVYGQSGTTVSGHSSEQGR